MEAAQRRGDTELANLAVHRGLGALPTSERLYRAWMRLAAADRDPALIESIYRSLQSAVAADDGGGGLQPTGETRALYEALLRSASRQHEPVGG